MKKFLIAPLFFAVLIGRAQKPVKESSAISHPKLVVGIVVDQMRWDYLTRYYPLFQANGGFRRMLGDGFSFDNTQIPYVPTVTACGHTCVYTGSIPALHGIVGNNWWDNRLQKGMYCSEDKSVKGVGSKTEEDGQMSPKNMLTTSVCDELRLASNFASKVIGIAIKDRGAILPAGHSANAAYWYESKTGNFISSTYYMNELPGWVQQFNGRKLPDSLYRLGWKTALPAATYSLYSSADDKAYESKPFGKEALGFPYDLSKFVGKDYSKISSTPWGNTLTAEMAKAAVLAEKLGQGSATDFLAVSFSSPDYIGHSFGPNSWENADDYVRLDQELGKFFQFLDAQLGAKSYTVFLTADHAVAHIPGYLKENRIPGGLLDMSGMMKDMNLQIKQRYGIDNAIASIMNEQVYLSRKRMDTSKADVVEIKNFIVQYLLKEENITHAFSSDDVLITPLPKVIREMYANGFHPSRSGDISFIPKPGYFIGGSTGTTHGSPFQYDTHIPLLWYGWGIKKGSSNKMVYMTDIAPTVAALLRIQAPNGNVGNVLDDALLTETGKAHK
ncbi:MAG: alkaline phosphatase family protein [Chitinophagaceae bacterium]|nr:alkaline phosphatase family protein [Chitinophagaceae bacterium]MCA6477029.1 alkaline phosphatase family protein [Chitinophagaceae bacterium]MCA6497379.1 alkaline phosphatase family protein [Chitinophagaceae bacterium]